MHIAMGIQIERRMARQNKLNEPGNIFSRRTDVDGNFGKRNCVVFY